MDIGFFTQFCLFFVGISTISACIITMVLGAIFVAGFLRYWWDCTWDWRKYGAWISVTRSYDLTSLFVPGAFLFMLEVGIVGSFLAAIF